MAKRKRSHSLPDWERLTNDALDLYTALDIDQGWKDLRKRAQARNLLHKSGNAKVLRRIWTRWAAAAVFLLALSYAGFRFFTIDSTQLGADSTSLAQDIDPGGNKAVLLFSDGKSIQLREDQQSISIRPEGIAYADGSLVTEPLADTASVVVLVPRAGEYEVNLPDGTNVWLNAESSLRYPSRFTPENRRVELRGEAYFEVAHDPAHPFTVSTATQQVVVLGTRFNIQAYTDEPQTKTTLIEGSVQVQYLLTDERVLLKPGQHAITDQYTLWTAPAEQEQVLAWKQGKFVFHEQNLASIMRQVSRWYDVDVQFEQEALRQLTFGGTVSRTNRLSTVLKAIENTGQVTFESHGNVIRVKHANNNQQQ